MDRRKKHAAIILAMALAGLGGVLSPGCDHPGDILDIQPVDPSRALFVREDKAGGRIPKVYLELGEAHKGVIWRQKIEHARVFSDRSSLSPNTVVTDGVVVLRSTLANDGDTFADKPTRLQGFRLADGAPLWTVSPMGDATDLSRESFRLHRLSLLAKDDLVMAFYGCEALVAQPSKVIAFDVHTGVERWRADLERWPADIAHGVAPLYYFDGPAWIRGGSLVVLSGRTLTVIELATGKTSMSVLSGGIPCVTERAIWFTAGSELREIALDSLAQRTLSTPSAVAVALHGPCARRDGALWAVASEPAARTGPSKATPSRSSPRRASSRSIPPREPFGGASSSGESASARPAMLTHVGTHLFAAVCESSNHNSVVRISSNGTLTRAYAAGMPDTGPTSMFGDDRSVWLGYTPGYGRASKGSHFGGYPQTDIFRFLHAPTPQWSMVSGYAETRYVEREPWRRLPQSTHSIVFTLVTTGRTGRLLGSYDDICGCTTWFLLPEPLPQDATSIVRDMKKLGTGGARELQDGRVLFREYDSDPGPDDKLHLFARLGYLERLFSNNDAALSYLSKDSKAIDQYELEIADDKQPTRKARLRRFHQGSLSLHDVPDQGILGQKYSIVSQQMEPVLVVGNDGSAWFGAGGALLGFDGEHWTRIDWTDDTVKSAALVERVEPHEIWFRANGDLLRVAR